MKNETAVDALGNPIIIGNHYGYCHSSNGITITTFGRCIKIKNGKVTLNSAVKKTYVYISKGPQVPNSIIGNLNNRIVASIICFPITITDLKIVNNV